MKNTANEPNYTIRNIFQSFTGQIGGEASELKDNQSLINKHFQYLDKIKDNTDKKYLIGARSEINVSQIDRTELTIKYNNIL